MIRQCAGWISRYVAHPDPRMRYGNRIAVLVGTNQPLFPLTLYAVMGEAARPSLWGIPSTIVFCVIPLVARRHALLAKILLSLYASLHTAGYVLLMGQHAGFELFFTSCILLAALLFGPKQRAMGWALCAVPMGLFLALQQLPVHDVAGGVDVVAVLWQVNAISVACLTALMGMLAPQPDDGYP